MVSPLGSTSLILRSIRRRPFRNIVTILCFVIIASSLLSVHFLVGGAQNSVEAGMDRLGADILLIPQQYVKVGEAALLTGKPTTFAFEESILPRITGIEGVEKVSPQIYIATLQNQGCCSTFLQLIAFDPATDFTIIPWLNTELHRELRQNECIVGAGIIGPIGYNLTFYGHDFTIAGRLDPSGMGIDSSVFIQMEDAYTMSEESGFRAARPVGIQNGQISAVLVRVKPGEDRDIVANAIRSELPQAYPYMATTMAKRVSAQLGLTEQVLYTITGVVTLVAFPFMALVSSLVANERKREIALLRAMGATRSFVFRVIFAEALVLSLAGALIGVGATSLVIFLFAPAITTSLQIPFLWPPLWEILGDVAIAIGFAVVLGGAASLYPAYQSARQDPYEAIRRGDV